MNPKVRRVSLQPKEMAFTEGTKFYIIQPSTFRGQTTASTSSSIKPAAPPVLLVTSSPAAEAPCPKGNKGRWDTSRDLALLREVVLARPFQYKARTPARSKVWANIAAALQARGEKATKRSVRDRVRELMEKVKSRKRKERAASGITVEETDDERKIREIVEDLLQEEKDIEGATPTNDDDEERKEMAGEEMRQRACENFGESGKGNKPRWDTSRDLALLGEVVLARPFQHKVKTPARSKVWADIATALQARGEKVTKRSVRDRVRELMEKAKSTKSEERAASGIKVKETDDERQIREIMEDLVQKEQDIDRATTTKDDEERKKMPGAEMRKRACKTSWESRKRHREEGTAAIRRRSGNEMMELMVKKLELDGELRREELQFKKELEEKRRLEDVERERRQEERERRQEERERRQEELQRQLLEQQQKFQQELLQQQQQAQQQNQQMQLVMMRFMKYFEKKE